MKNITKSIFAALAVLGALTACVREDYERATADELEGHQYFFPKTIPAEFDVAEGITGFDIPIQRVVTNDASTITVKVSDPSKYFYPGENEEVTVSFKAGEEKAFIHINVAYEDFEFGDERKIQYTIANETTPYGNSTLTAVVALPEWFTIYSMKTYQKQWADPTFVPENPELATFSDAFMFEDSYDVEVQGSYASPKKFRLVHPYDEGLEAEEYAPNYVANGPSEAIVFEILDPGTEIETVDSDGNPTTVVLTQEDLVFFPEFYTGYYMPTYGAEVKCYHPADGFKATGSEDKWTHNKVLRWQKTPAEAPEGFSRIPAVIQLAPFYYMDGVGGWNYSQNDEVITIIFPGVKLGKFTVELSYSGMFTDKKGGLYAVANTKIGKDTKVAKAALAFTDDPNEVRAIIDGGGADVLSFTESGEIRLPMPEEAESGKYTIVVVTYNSDDEAEESTYVTFSYTSPGTTPTGPKEVPLDEFFTANDYYDSYDLATLTSTKWDIYAIPMGENDWLGSRYFLGSYQFEDAGEGLVTLAGLGGGETGGYDDKLTFEYDEEEGAIYTTYTGLGQFDYNGTTLYINDEYLTTDDKYYPVDYALTGILVDKGLIAFVGNPGYISQYGITFNGLSFELYDTEDREYKEDEDGVSNYWGPLDSFKEIILADPAIYEHPEESSVSSKKSVAKKVSSPAKTVSRRPFSNVGLYKFEKKPAYKVIASGRVSSYRRAFEQHLR